MRALISGVLALVVLVTVWSFGGPVMNAQAALTDKCQVIQNPKVGNIDWTPVKTSRVCDGTAYANGAVAGVTSQSRNRVTVSYDEANSSLPQLTRTTVHELTHAVEYRTTDALRIELYAFLGVDMPGSYFSLPTSSGTDINEWKRNSRERLAESVVYCATGANSFSGMDLVKTAQCPGFLTTFNQAIAATA